MRSIEFIGLPGVGKTTLSNGVVTFLQGKLPVTLLTAEKAAYYGAKEHCDKVLRNILRLLPETLGQRSFNAVNGRTYWEQDFVFDYILENFKLLQTILEDPFLRQYPARELKVVFSSLVRSGALHKCLQKSLKDDSWILFDEGMLQKSMMFVSCSGVATQQVVEQYLSLVSLPDVVVNLHVDKDTCLNRMVERSKGLTNRLRSLAREEMEDFLDHSLAHWRFVIAWLKANTDIPVLEIETDQTESELISYLGIELEKIIGGRQDVPHGV